MSVFTKVEGEVKTLAHEAETVLQKLFVAEPKVEQVAVTTINVVAPLVVGIAAVTGSEPEAAAITAVVSLVKSDLAAVQITLNQAGAGTPNVTVKSLLAAVNANLASLLTAGMIKDATTLATVTKDVQTISAALDVLISAL